MCDSWINIYNGRGYVTLDSKGIFGIQDLTQKKQCGIQENASYLTENSLQLPVEAGLAKFKHGTRAGLFCLYVDNSANYTFEGQMLNQPGAR